MCSCCQYLGPPCLSPSSSSQISLCLCRRAERDTGSCVGTSVPYEHCFVLNTPGAMLWAVDHFFAPQSGQGKESQGRENLKSCRSPFEVSVHRMVHTGSRCVPAGTGSWKVGLHATLGWPKEKGEHIEQRLRVTWWLEASTWLWV